MSLAAANDAAAGAFDVDHLDELARFYADQGYALLRGLWDDAAMDRIEASCVELQDGVVAGRFDPIHGSTTLAGGWDGDGPRPFANYVVDVTALEPALRHEIRHPVTERLVEHWLGEHWLREGSGFGVVYQDARPGPESGYARIGWHADWQSGPQLDIWPSVAFTIHIDATSPANGFLRVVPGSHKWATPAPYENVNGAIVPDGSRAAAGHGEEAPPFPMPLRFEKIPGEVAVYAERGDLLFHDAYLWHSAARATEDDAVRRHLRGGFHSGAQIDEPPGEGFVKNAAR